MFPANVFFAVTAKTLTDGLCEQIRQFVIEHPDTVLVAIDTFQVVRGSDTNTSYGSDYQEVQQIKQLVDELSISVLLVHHLQKQGNKLSGTTGISGAVDAAFVLDKSNRSHSNATLICTGPDIEYRELSSNSQKRIVPGNLVADSAEEPMLLLPKEMVSFMKFMRERISFLGSNSELADAFNARSDTAIFKGS